MVHTSQTDGFRLRRASGSYSVSMQGLPGPQDVDSGVFVPVVDGTAIAGPLPNIQRQGFLQNSATATQFTTRKPAVNFDHLFAVHCRLGLDSPDCGPDTSVIQAASKTVIFCHVTQSQIFDADQIEPGVKIPGKLIESVLARVGNLFMQFCQLYLLFVVPCRTLLFPGKVLLSAFHALMVFVQVARVGNSLPGGKRSQAVDAKVNPDILPGCWQRGRLYVNHHRDKISTGWFVDNSDAGWLNRNFSGPLNLEPTDLGKQKALVADLKPEPRTGIFRRLLPALSLKRGIPGTFLKEVAESGLQVAKRLLHRDTGHFVQPQVVRPPLEISKCGAGLQVVHAFALLKSLSALIQKVVIHISDAAESAGQNLLLFGRWIASEIPSLFHTLHFKRGSCKSQALKLNYGGGVSSPA